MSQAVAKDYKPEDKTLFGFWVYLMTDCVLFASLFATFAVLRANTYNGPAAEDIISLPYVLTQTLILLASSFACGLALLSARYGKKQWTLVLFGLTFLLGLAFLGMELHEFAHLYNEGNSWRRSAFLSSFFVLVATHGLHISVGLMWMGTMMTKVFQRGLTDGNIKKLTMLALFWHFLDVVWIFIFTIVYMMGAVL